MENVTMDLNKFRSRLPSPMYTRDTNIWSVLKNCIGKELTKITMPIQFNEPLSFLQRISEYMEYSYLLNLASNCTDPLQRTQYVVAFAVSSFSSNYGRLGKPFNPLLGETFELVRNDFRFISEQVTHHPPVSSFHAESTQNLWLFYGSVHPKLKFCGKSIEIQPKGTITIRLLKWNEVYTWKNIICCVHNVIVGKLWMEQYGTMEIINHTNNFSCVLNFKDANSNLSNLHCVDGFIIDQSSAKLCYVYGKWTEGLYAVDYEIYQKCTLNNYNHASISKLPKNTVISKLKSLKISNNNNSSSSGSFLQRITQSIDNEKIEDIDSTAKVHFEHSKLLWKSEPRYEHSEQYYNFSKFAMTLNEISDEQLALLCRTDSRLRPDIRKFEECCIEEASDLKHQLEDKQRNMCKIHKENKIEWKPKWFTLSKNPYMQGEDDWIFTNDYWKRNFENTYDIF